MIKTSSLSLLSNQLAGLVTVSALAFGYAVTASVFSQSAEEYFIASAICITASLVFIWNQKLNTLLTLPAWLLFLVFVVGYLIKFFWMATLASVDEVPWDVFPLVRLAMALDNQTAMRTFWLITFGFVTFVAVSSFNTYRAVGLPASKSVYSPANYSIRTIAVVGTALLLLTHFLAARFDLLNAGVLQERLPFRLGGWVHYIRQSVIPNIFIIIFAFGSWQRSRTWQLLGLVLVIVLALDEVALRTTRAGVLFNGLLIVFYLIASSRKFELKYAAAGALALIVTFLLFPVISQYRVLRSTGDAASLAHVAAAFGESQIEHNESGLLSAGAVNTIARLVGADSMLFIGDNFELVLEDNLSVITSFGSVAGYFTRRVVEYPEGTAHGEAPSLLGWFLIVGGYWGFVLFALYLLATWRLWLWLWRSSLRLKAVAQAQFLLNWLMLSSEGTIETIAFHLVVVALTICAIEWMLRFEEKVRRLVPHTLS